MERVLEPEIMDDPLGAHAYAAADFSVPNQAFAERLVQTFGEDLGEIIDIGCGPADVPIRIARLLPTSRVTAVDASEAMLSLARDRVREEKLENTVRIVQGRVPSLPFPAASFDTVVSNSLLHHLPNPLPFWEEVKRIAKPGAHFMLVDLFRPESKERAASIVEQAAGNEHALLKQDFYHSLLAAFTVDEIRTQLYRSDLGQLQVKLISERHFLVSGRV